MNKPKVQTKKYLDWVELKPYLAQKYPKLKLEKAISLLAEHGTIHNGCYVSLEEPCEGMYEPAIEELAKAIFAEFPEAAGKYGDISIWVWW